MDAGDAADRPPGAALKAAVREADRLLALHDVDHLAAAEPDTVRFRLYHLPARLTKHARGRWLRIESTWPWATAFATAWTRLSDLPTATWRRQNTAPTKTRKEDDQQRPGPVEPGVPAASREGPPSKDRDHYGRTVDRAEFTPLVKNRGQTWINSYDREVRV